MAVLLGLVLGSFFNTVIYRLPRGESVVYPPSRCPACGHRLGPGELVPVLSFLWLGGRCRECRARISWRYPMVEAGTAALFLLLYLQFGGAPRAVHYLLLASFLVVIGAIDLEHRVIPNRLVAAGLLLGFPSALATGAIPLREAGLGLVVVGGVVLLVAEASRGGMGGGDVKLAALIGFYLGWRAGLAAFLAAVFLGAGAGLVLIALGLKTRKDYIPFGPFLGAGALVAMLWGRAPWGG